MSAKLQIRPPLAEPDPITDNVPLNQVDIVLASIRQIQVDAEQICNDADDVEDARFLAASIADTCQRILSYPVDGVTGPQAEKQPMALVATQGKNGCRVTAARDRLASLSTRELEIFTFLAEGQSSVEIASKLSRSSKTINNHRTRILQKLGLKNATELVRLAVHSGLVSV